MRRMLSAFVVVTFLLLFSENVSACAAITQKGTVCKRAASPGSAYCWQHGGTTKAERERAESPRVDPQPERKIPAPVQKKVEVAPEIKAPEPKKELTDDEVKALWAAKLKAATKYTLNDGTEIYTQRDIPVDDEYILQDCSGKWQNVKKTLVAKITRPEKSVITRESKP